MEREGGDERRMRILERRTGLGREFKFAWKEASQAAVFAKFILVIINLGKKCLLVAELGRSVLGLAPIREISQPG